jgi:hypothetical protein
MPLLDHFQPPLLGHRHWEGFHGWWAAEIAADLNNRLPDAYFAEFQVTLGTRIEVDVATFEADEKSKEQSGSTEGSVLTEVWAPPAPVAVMPALFPDDIEVQVFSNEAGPVLVAAIELVSPGNKDRPQARRGFAAKCAAYLQRGIGLILVDIVTSRHANLHDELAALLGNQAEFAFPAAAALYATAYRPVQRQETSEIDLWREPLAVGKILPTLPLAVRGLDCMPVDLEETYMAARKRGRVG